MTPIMKYALPGGSMLRWRAVDGASEIVEDITGKRKIVEIRVVNKSESQCAFLTLLRTSIMTVIFENRGDVSFAYASRGPDGREMVIGDKAAWEALDYSIVGLEDFQQESERSLLAERIAGVQAKQNCIRIGMAKAASYNDADCAKLLATIKQQMPHVYRWLIEDAEAILEAIEGR